MNIMKAKLLLENVVSLENEDFSNMKFQSAQIEFLHFSKF